MIGRGGSTEKADLEDTSVVFIYFINIYIERELFFYT